MRKFWEYYRINLTERFTSQTESIIWFLTETVPVLAMTSLWKTLEISGQISHQRAGELTLYYILSMFITRTVSTYFEEWMIDEIKDGHFSFNLLKPISIRFYLFAHQLASRTNGTIYTIPIFIILAPYYLPTLLSVISGYKITIFGLMMIITFAQKFMTSWLISLASFWIDQASALNHLKWVCEGVFGGSWLPLTFFPIWWQNISKFTPFYTWYYFPINYLTSKSVSTIDLFWAFGSSIVWLILLIIFGEYFWRKSIKRYSAVGA